MSLFLLQHPVHTHRVASRVEVNDIHNQPTPSESESDGIGSESKQTAHS